MARLVLTAQDFAFGPIGKLLYLAEVLKERKHKLIFVGFGTSLQLAKKFPFDEIHEIDTENPKSTLTLETVIFKSDAVISSMDIPSVIAAKKLKKVSVWVDCLFWFWPNIPEEVFDADLYIRERSLDDSVNEERYGTKIKNLQTVGPIMGRVEKHVRKNQALISFGGAQATYAYQVGRDTNYPFLMTDILSKQVNWTNFERVILATSEKVVKLLKTRFPSSLFDFTTLAHDKFLTEMSQSQILLTTPGLITAQGAFYSETPTIFIPPSNDSQYLQLEELRSLGLASASVGLVDYLPKLDLLHIPGKESTRLVLNQLRLLEKSPDIQTKIGIRINELIQTYNVWLNESVAKNKVYIDSLGGNGASLVTEKIMKLIDSKVSI